ncbi:CASP-like protein 2U1 [Dichanthelium oligosanthes]|uniref:CASP-like protein n=1 Tax=Dichanthelium oligosanthes TaxID=888268 RepID=A0A1E5UZE9_9POAL|nr:CASP-like protein 2U1 [Dichanthelium oligosanthes]
MAGAVAERKVKVAEVSLRALLCGLAALAAALVATDSQTRTFFSFDKKATFTDMKAMVFLVVASGVAAGYSLLQAARCCVAVARGTGSTPLLSRALAWCVFSCDQALAYVLLAAVAAALQASVIAKRGQPELQWMGICGMYGAFCRQAGGGLASAVAAGLAAVLLAFLSAFNLFRLYGDKSGGAARNGGGATW